VRCWSPIAVVALVVVVALAGARGRGVAELVVLARRHEPVRSAVFTW
jgi:flagellar biosynthesis/type III secretory pathway ATPase